MATQHFFHEVDDDWHDDGPPFDDDEGEETIPDEEPEDCWVDLEK